MSPKQAEKERDLLIRASELLATTLSSEERLSMLARLAVEDLADWCGVDVLDHGKIRRVAVAHRVPEREAAVLELCRHVLSPEAPGGTPQVIRTGEPILYPEIPEETVDALAVDAEHREAIRRLGARSSMVVPLISRGTVIGAIALVSSESGRRYTPHDLVVAEVLARRTAVAIDNARLFEEGERARASLESQAGELEAQVEELQNQAMQLEESQAELEITNDELAHANEELRTRTAELECMQREAEAANESLRSEVRERIRVQEQLRRSELSYRSLFDSLTDLVFILDVDGHFLNVNDAVLERFGYAREEILGGTPAMLAAPALVDPNQTDRRIQRAAEGIPQRFEFLARTKSGEVFPKELVLTRGEYFGAPVVIAVGRDISERKRAEDVIRESEQRFRQLADHVSAVFWLFDNTERRIIYVSPRFEAVWGRAAEDLYMDPQVWVYGLHPDDRDRVIATTETARDREYEIDYRIIRPDGEVRWIRDRGYPIRDGVGRVYRTGGVAEDITEWKRADAERAAAELHYRWLVMRAPYGVFALDTEGRITELNPAGARIVGRSADEVIGQHITHVIAPEDRAGTLAANQRLLDGGREHLAIELHALRPSGEQRLLDVILDSIRDADRIVGIHGTARDITDERAHQEQMRLLTTALEGLEDGVSVARFDGQLVYANSTHARMLGYDRGTGPLPNSNLFIPDEAEARRMEQVIRAVVELGSWTGRVRRRRASDGRIVPMELIAGKVEREGGESLVFTITRDLSDEIQREQQLRRAERLASLGTLIGGVAHELNNPLHAIRSFAELLLLDERGAEDREALEIIRREADRAAKIVSDLRVTARASQDGDRVRAAIDLNDVVLHILKLRRYAMETHNIEVTEELAVDLPLVLANRAEIEQVVLNLVVNSEQALAARSANRRLTIRTRGTPDGASVHVTDNGRGIPAADLEQIFDPFFTTKGPGEGTGLGLSLVHGIVTEHGGEIRVDSEPGRGTTFRVSLPRAEVDVGVSARPSPMPTCALRLLVVDDEESVRRASVRALEHLGHRVDAAEDGADALRMLDQAEYDVILSDLRMPGLDGEELFNRLRDQGNGLERRLVFVTGDAASPQALRLETDSEIPVLIKPVRLDDLSLAIELVSRREPPRGSESCR